MVKIASPGEMGLPEKFDSWRPNQIAALEFLDENRDKRVRAACVPTGSGKSPLAVAEAIRSGLNTCIVTQTKGLQQQYIDDFGGIGMVSIMGRDNYQCGLRDDFTCQDGYAARCPYKGSPTCPATKAELKARLSKLVVTNYAKWTSSKKFGQGMDHFEQVIFDEGDCAPDALASAMRIEFNHKEIEETLGVAFPSNLMFDKHWDPGLNGYNMKVWRGWANETKHPVERGMIETYNKIKSTSQPRWTWVKHYTHMRNLLRRLATIGTANPDHWVVDETEKGYIFDPIRPGRYAEACLLLQLPHVLFLSATIRPKTLTLSGVYKGSYKKEGRDGSIETENYAFTEYDSDFDPNDCPVYYIPTQFVDRRHPDNSMLWMRLDQWLSRRKKTSGIVHTVSYARKDEIIAYSHFAKQMLFNERGEPSAALVEAYKKSPRGTFLISPTVGRGYDFPGIECEHTFMAKVPFEPPSKIVRARETDDPEYRLYRALQNIIQAFGRGNRFKGDRGDGAICDNNMEWFYPKAKYLATRSFQKRYRPVDMIPPPLEPM